MLFEVFLRESVESKRGDRAFKKGRRHPPCTAGAAPAAEVIAVDRNEVLIHVRLPFIGIVTYLATDWALRCGRELVPVISHGYRGQPSAKSASPYS